MQVPRRGALDETAVIPVGRAAPKLRIYWPSASEVLDLGTTVAVPPLAPAAVVVKEKDAPPRSVTVKVVLGVQ